MADFNVRVVVDPANASRGARRVRRELEQTENSADSLRSTIQRAFAFVGIGIGIREVIQLTDTFTNLQNRLRTVTQGQDQLTQVTEELFQIARRTRSSFEGTIELYARVGLAARDLGVSQRQLTQFTESLNQAIILSGASGAEAQAGLIQLSQGLASGALRGDELRSVLEQLPAVADVIAQELGVTRGELRELGSQGEITADIVLRAFANAREELSQRFGVTVPTISQAFIILRNQVIRVVGEFVTASGASRSFANAIITIANNAETILRAFSALSITIGTTFAAQAVPRSIAAVRTFTAVLAANPIGAIAIALTTIISLLITFSDQITFGADGLISLRDIAVSAFQLIVDGIQPVLVFLRDGLSAAVEVVINSLTGFGLTFRDVLDAARFAINSIIGLHVGLQRVILLIFNRIRESIVPVFSEDIAQTIVAAFRSVIDFISRTFDQVVSIVTRALNIVGIASQRLGNTIDVAFELPELRIPRNIVDFGTEIRDEFLSGFNRDFVGEFISLVDPAFQALQQRAADIAQQRQAENVRQEENRATQAAADSVEVRRMGQDLAAEAIQSLQREAELLRLTNSEREIQTQLLQIENEIKGELTDTQRAAIESQLRENQQLQRQADLLEEIQGPRQEFIATQQALNTLLAEGRINQDQFNTAIAQTGLGMQLGQLREELTPTTELDRLRDELQMRQDLINQFQEARLISEQEANNLLLEANRAYNDAVTENELSRYSTQLQAAQSTFSSLSQISRAFVGEQSSVYQTLFAISKGFAIADAIVQIQGAIAKAANNPFPANLSAIATVAAQTARIVSTIQGTQFSGGFQTGGQFRVGGAGGADSQLVMFRATPNETVSVRTPSQQRGFERQESPAQTTGNQGGIRIVNVTDPGMLEDFLTSPAGERTLVNAIQRNQSQVSQIVGG